MIQEKIVFVKSKKQVASNVTPLYNDQDDLCSDPLTKSNIFNKNFQSVSTNEDFSTMSRLNSSFLTMSHITIDASSVENLLRKLNPHKATGPDAIPAHLLCEISAEVAPALTFVFHMSLDTGQIPGDWRMAYIVPVYKRRDKCSVNNYCPVCITSLFKSKGTHIVFQHYATFRQKLYFDGHSHRFHKKALM